MQTCVGLVLADAVSLSSSEIRKCCSLGVLIPSGSYTVSTSSSMGFLGLWEI